MTTELFRKILVATDGSQRNQTAVAESLRIGRASGAEIHAVYVLDTGTLETASPEMVIGDAWSLMQREAEEALSRVREMAGDVRLVTATLTGKPALEIIRYAASHGVDLIVIGTQGKRGIERLLLGSVAENIIRTAQCDVLVVK